MQLSQASRPIMWNISHPWIMYLLLVIAMFVFAYGLYLRIGFWMRGKEDNERFSNWGKRFLKMMKEVFLHSKILRNKFPGIFHAFIFYSFLVLFITTSIIALDYDLHTNFFRGYLYVFFTIGADLGGLFILIGIAMAAYRRYVTKPKTIDTGIDDTWSLILIALLVITGFLTEGLRIATIGDKWAYLSPVGLAVSYLFKGISPQAGRAWHVGLWWTHTVLAMTWIATIPYTKFFHLLTVPGNIFFSKLEPKGALKHVDIEALLESEDFDEESFNVGIERADEFTWKQRMDFDACISCGRCEELCPAFIAGEDFSPKRLIASLKKITHEYDDKFRAAKEEAELNPAKSVGAAAMPDAPMIVGEAFGEDFVWSCRTCGACIEACPASIQHVDTLMEIRQNEVVMQGRMPAEAAKALKTLESLGNPFGAKDEVIEWLKENNVRIVGPGEKVDVIYWIGCATSFDPTKRKIAEDMFRLLDAVGIDFGVLGEDEYCCGDPARSLGQDHLFQTIAKQQIEEFMKRDFNILLVSCPHGYNTFKNEYPNFGGHFRVVHHSEFLHEMLYSKELLPIFETHRHLTYHDPCYLGRYQNIYDPAREAIKAVPNSDFHEMKNHHEKSLCCGAGGGHFWMDLKKGERINNIRVQQALDINADTIITSCPFCMQMLDDSVKIMNVDEQVEVMDIVTFMLEGLEGEKRKAKH